MSGAAHPTNSTSFAAAPSHRGISRRMTSIYLRSFSIRINRRFRLADARPVVPIPANGSRTTSLFANRSGFALFARFLCLVEQRHRLVRCFHCYNMGNAPPGRKQKQTRRERKSARRDRAAYEFRWAVADARIGDLAGGGAHRPAARRKTGVRGPRPGPGAGGTGPSEFSQRRVLSPRVGNYCAAGVLSALARKRPPDRLMENAGATAFHGPPRRVFFSKSLSKSVSKSVSKSRLKSGSEVGIGTENDPLLKRLRLTNPAANPILRPTLV